MNLKKIYWFAFYNCTSPSVRYRALYPLRHLENYFGIQTELVIPSYRWKGISRFLKVYFSLLFSRRNNSLIVIQRVHSDFLYARLLKFMVWLSPKHTVYDLDDADYLEHDPATLFYFVKKCSMVTVGSRELRGNLRPLNKNIYLNTSPTPDLRITKQNRNEVLTIGWIGDFGGAHKESLFKSFFPALLDLPFPVKLVMMGVGRKNKSDFGLIENYFSQQKNVELVMPRQIDWNDEFGIQQQVCDFDIGIATLVDTELHRSKSAFKAKQYLNNGVPVLSSDIPENNFIIKHGFNGFLCSEAADFRHRIVQFKYMSDEEYADLSRNARRSVSEFDLNHYCKRLIELTGKIRTHPETVETVEEFEQAQSKTAGV